MRKREFNHSGTLQLRRGNRYMYPKSSAYTQTHTIKQSLQAFGVSSKQTHAPTPCHFCPFYITIPDNLQKATDHNSNTHKYNHSQSCLLATALADIHAGLKMKDVYNLQCTLFDATLFI